MFSKLAFPTIPMIGVTTSLTKEVTIAVKAAPMMMPTARSSTLPFAIKSRNSLSMVTEDSRCGLGFDASAVAVIKKADGESHCPLRNRLPRHGRGLKVLWSLVRLEAHAGAAYGSRQYGRRSRRPYRLARS